MKQVVIIGGGLAGAAAALALARAPDSAQRFSITLIESKSRLGGRVGSYTDPVSGQAIDYCQHVGMNCCTGLKQLIDWLDQADQWSTVDELYFYGPQAQRQRLRALPWLPAPLHLAGWLWQWPGLTLRERTQIARGMWAIDRVPLQGPQSKLLENSSALEWLQLHGQSARVLENFWSTILVSALGEQLDRVGLLPMAKVFQDGFLRERTAYHLLIPQRPLDELFGRQLHQALIDHGVDVQLSNSVTEFEWEAAHCRRLQLASGDQLSPDHLIVAVPWHAVSGLLSSCPDARVQSILGQAQQLRPSPISGVHTWWDRAWLPTPHAVLVGRLCQWIFPHADATGSRADSREHYYQIVISAAHDLPRGDNAAVIARIQADLEQVFVEARAAKLLRVKVVTDPLAVFSVGPGSGQLRPRAGSIDGNIYWAGDWTHTGWPATMEGAIRSGLVAADAVGRCLRNRQ